MAIDAVESDTCEALVVQDFDGVAVEEGNTLASEVDWQGWTRERMVAGEAVVTHLPFGFHSRASFCASRSSSEVIRMASASSSTIPAFTPLAAPSLYHI